MAGFAQDALLAHFTDLSKYRLGAGRTDVCLETPISYRKVYRKGQSPDTPIITQAVRVLFTEGWEALTESELTEAFDHWTFHQMSAEDAEEKLTQDIDEAFATLLAERREYLFKDGWPTLSRLQRRVRRTIGKFEDAVVVLIKAGVMSHHFGVFIYHDRRARKTALFHKFEDWFMQPIRKELQSHLTTLNDMWPLLVLWREELVFHRGHGLQLQQLDAPQLPSLEYTALLNTPASSLGLGHVPIARILNMLFGAHFRRDPNSPQHILCFCGF